MSLNGNGLEIVQESYMLLGRFSEATVASIGPEL
jgi:hypothetical protein